MILDTIVFGYFNIYYQTCYLISVFNDGSRKELLNLQGTIPVVYKGNLFLK